MLSRIVRPSTLLVTRMGQVRRISFDPKPGPPRLEEKYQKEFERLQQIVNSQSVIDEYNAELKSEGHKNDLSNEDILDKNDIGLFHPAYNKTIPEFEGDVNPKTGEVGGPKQDPLRHGDYSFNGRVTDF